MRRLLISVVGSIALLALLLVGCTDQQPVSPNQSATGLAPLVLVKGSASNVAPDRYIVVLNQSVKDIPAVASEMARSNGFAIEHVYQHALKGFSAVIPEARLNALRSDPRVAYIEQDRVVTLAPPPGKGPGGGSQAQVVPWGVTRVGGPLNGSGKVAWVIDTGIDLDHADLNVDVNRSRNFVTRGKDSPDDGNGHGTHVAGTIGAIDNNIDVVGVAAGATVVAVRVLDNSGSGFYSWVIAGVDYVAGAAAAGDAANMSLGGPPSQALDDAILAAAGNGIKFALAAGNDGAYAGDFSPARVNHANVYTISAIDQNDCMPSWSNWGNPPVDYAAPGVGVLSTKSGGGTTTFSGTSMATPHVTGILLLRGVRSDGSACNDPDGKPDPIAHF